MEEKKPEIEVRELAEKFFEEAMRTLDNDDRKKEVESEKETYIGVWILGYRAGEVQSSAPLTQSAAAFIREANNSDLGGVEKMEDTGGFVIGFAKWCTDSYYPEHGYWWSRTSDDKYTIDQLYDIFKQQKEK